MLGLNVEQLTTLIKRSRRFQTVGKLRSSRGILTADIHSEIGELSQISRGNEPPILCETIGFQDGSSQLMPYGASDDIHAGLTVVGLGRRLRVPVGDALLGRVINGLGFPIDRRGNLRICPEQPVRSTVPAALERARILEPVVTGVRVIDALMTFGRGQRLALLAGSGVGKSTLLGEIAKGSNADVNVVALVGERGREVGPFIEDCLGEEGLRKSVVIVATADEQPLLRIRAAEAAITIANAFRSRGKHVMFMLDSITRMATAQRELGLLLGEPPTLRGYPPSVFQMLSRTLESLGNAGTGSISSLISVLVDGNDFDEPVSDSVRSLVDGHILLDRELAQHGHFPAVNIGQSLSRLFRDITSDRHRKAAMSLRDVLATYAEIEDLLRVGAYVTGTSHRIDKAIHLKKSIDDFVKQDIGDRTSFDQTVEELCRLTSSWDE